LKGFYSAGEFIFPCHSARFDVKSVTWHTAVRILFFFSLHPLNLEEFDIRIVPYRRINVPQVDDTPHIGPE
jgi:hypothetical protein